MIPPHMPSCETTPFRIGPCAYRSMVLRLSVYVSSVEQCINLHCLLLCQAVLRTTLWRHIAQPRRSASRFDALSARTFKLAVSRASWILAGIVLCSCFWPLAWSLPQRVKKPIRFDTKFAPSPKEDGAYPRKASGKRLLTDRRCARNAAKAWAIPRWARCRQPSSRP